MRPLALLVLVPLAGCLGLGAPPAPQPSGTLAVHMLDVGQGEALLLLTPGGRAVLFEGGPSKAGPGVVADLRALGVQRVDWMVVSHAHEDHVGGLLDVLGAMPVDRLVSPAGQPDREEHRRLLQEVARRGIPLLAPAAGSTLDVDPALEVRVLNPPSPLREGSEPEHLNGLVLLVRHGACDVLLTGDAPTMVQLEAHALAPVDLEVLQVGHHGSVDATSNATLRAWKPELALISAGAGNRFDHPHPATLDRLAAYGVHVLRTDLQGRLTVRSDGQRVSAGASMGPAGFEPATCAL